MPAIFFFDLSESGQAWPNVERVIDMIGTKKKKKLNHV